MSSSKTLLPVIGIPASHRAFDRMRVHVVGDSNVNAIVKVSGGMPIMIPALGDDLDIESVLDRIDGLLLTGGATNIEPHHYDGDPARPGDDHDADRDATSLPLIRAAVDKGIPLFAVCRGFQEFNVALGGSLHQFLHEIPGRMDHRRDRTKPIGSQMAPCHDINVTEDGVLSGIIGANRAGVNSLHGQGIDKVAPGLTVEATAPDSTIEGLSLSGADSFALGVQWHPEFSAEEDPVSRALFEAFGDATRTRAETRRTNGSG